MTISFNEKLHSFFNNRWLVFVAAMWIQSCAGIAYLFGSISPTIKSSLQYNQRQLARLGVAKDLGDNLGFLAGSLAEILPVWGTFLIGAIQNFVGYGWVWLVVTGRAPVLPLWAMCILIFVGTNGETYFNTANLVSCVQNFPKNRGPVVGILKGFAGLSGAILTQVYALLHASDHSSLIAMIAIAPAIMVIALMFFIRPVAVNRHTPSSESLCSSIIYSICLLLASYLMGVMIVDDLLDLSYNVTVILTVILFVIILLPIIVPITLMFYPETKPTVEEPLIPNQENEDRNKSKEDDQEFLFSEMEDEKSDNMDFLPDRERQKKIDYLQAKLVAAAAEGAVRRSKRRPRRGEDFALAEALMKADFWLIFFSFLLGSGSGLTVIDNLGQMSQSLGYENTHVFVSMISIWNFLGRVGGGYFSEKIVKDYAYPRHIAMATAQLILAIGHFFFAMGWSCSMYVGTLLVGLGYGAHWAIVPAATSELFGLKKFGILYNFLTMANPAGTLVLSGVIASRIYDMESEKQAQARLPGPNSLLSSFSTFVHLEDAPKCEGSICFFLTSLIMSGLCIIAAILSMILVYRTKTVYAHLYGRPQR